MNEVFSETETSGMELVLTKEQAWKRNIENDKAEK